MLKINSEGLKVRKSILVVAIMSMLLVLSWFPFVSGSSITSTNLITSGDEKNCDTEPCVFLGDLQIECHGSYPFEILNALLGNCIFLFETRLSNHYEEDIIVEQHITLIGTRENRILDEFDHDFKLESKHLCITKYFTQNDWKHYGYQFGRFDFIWDINIPKKEESITLLFHGFVFGVGTILLNPKSGVVI